MSDEILKDYKILSAEITEKIDNTSTYESWLIIQEYIDRCLEENQQLKIQISAREEAYRKLEDNWNKLKEYIGQEWYSYDNDSVEFEVSKDILNKMKELERGVSDVED